MKILYRDEDILVCYKEAGLAVQNARPGCMDLESMLRNELRLENPESGVPYLAVVHRLDQPVAGILCFARNRQAAAVLSREVQDGSMEKVYHALCLPEPLLYKEETDLPRQGRLTDYLIKDPKTNLSRVVSEGTKGARKAVLDYQLLQARQGEALYEIRLHTGRHHQIRVQLSHAHLPIAGDRKYGRNVSNPLEKRSFPALCACRLTLLHPRTGKKMIFSVEDGLTEEHSKAE